jgi:hypothetical protein
MPLPVDRNYIPRTRHVNDGIDEPGTFIMLLPVKAIDETSPALISLMLPVIF